MGNCTSSMDALPIEGAKGLAEGKIQELFTKALSTKDGAQDELEQLISSNVDVNYKIENDLVGECYPLHLATKAGNVKAVQLLLKAGADPNLCDGKGQTPLYCALEDSKKEIVEELLEGKADPNICPEDGTKPLNKAIASSDGDLVDKLIKAGAAVNVDKGEAPLVTAVNGNHVDIIMILLKADASPVGLDFEFPNNESSDCLHSWATANELDEIAAWLAEKFSTAENPEIEEMEKEIKEASEREGGDGAEEVSEVPPEGEANEIEEAAPEENKPDEADGDAPEAPAENDETPAAEEVAENNETPAAEGVTESSEAEVHCENE